MDRLALTGPSSDLGRLESLDRPLDRPSRATCLARSRSREALRGDFGRSWPLPGAPRPFRIAFPCRRERDFSKILTSLLDGLPKPSGTHFGTLWAALGTLLGLFSALLGRTGPLLERSWGTPGGLLGALLALLRRTWGRQRPTGPPGDRFSEDFGSTWGSIWVGLATEFGEFQKRLSIRNYIHPDPSIYIYILVYLYSFSFSFLFSFSLSLSLSLSFHELIN